MAPNREFREAVNGVFDVRKLLEANGVRISTAGTFVCPMHVHETPSRSAKLYKDGKFFCFSESKMFGAYDVLTQLMGVSDEDLREKVKGKGVVILDEDRKILSESAKEIKKLFIVGSIGAREYAKRLYKEELRDA